MNKMQKVGEKYNKQITMAIDSRSLTAKKTGVQVYIIELVNRLVQVFDVTLYTHKPLHISCLSSLAKVSNLKIKIIPNFFFKQGPLWAQIVLPWVVRKEKPNVFWGPDHSLPILSKFIFDKKTKSMITLHDLAYIEVKKHVKFQTWLTNKLFFTRSVKMADLVLSVSQSTMQSTLANSKNIKRIELLYNGFNQIDCPTACNTVLQKYSLKNQQYFLFVGTLEGKKNLLRAAQAFEAAHSKMNSLVFVVVGQKGWRVAQDYQVLNTLVQKGIVQLLGYVSDEELACLYAKSFAFVFPSLYEGFGIPPLEAMSYGIPVLASYTSSIPEICGEAAIYFDPYNIDSIKEAMLQLYEDKNLYQMLSRRGTLQCRKFSWDESYKRLAKLVSTL